MSRLATARRRRRRLPWPAIVCLTAVAATGWTVVNRPHGTDPEPRPQAEAPAPAAPRRADLAWMFEPSPVLRGAGTTAAFTRDLPILALNTTLPASIVATAPAPAPSRVLAAATPAATLAATPTATPAALSPPRRVAALPPAPVPLPVSRPTGLLAAAPAAVPPSAVAPTVAPAAPTRVARRTLPRTRDVFRAAVAEEPSFLERLFGGNASPEAAAPRQALAYADPDAVATPRPRLFSTPSTASPSAGVAVYDISAGTVTMPSGQVLEAHSGYGDLMDDPRYVHVRMRGATPPGTYDMTERERPFHGVRAIRLNPVGGSGAIHGRDGILAHTYMLRAQPGASNGCVVFRDYDRFLQAFLRGEVRRLIVVAGNRGGRMNVADGRR